VCGYLTNCAICVRFIFIDFTSWKRPTPSFPSFDKNTLYINFQGFFVFLPSPNFRLGEFLQGQELVVYTSRNPHTLLHDFHCTAITTDNGQRYILRISVMIEMGDDVDFVHERNLHRTNVLVLFGNICVGWIRVLQRVY
jgi:hypothetical protein